MLTLSEVTYRIEKRRLLDRANAQVPDGAKVGLVGRNGVGKSTLLNLIRGVLEPEGRHDRVAGQPAHRISRPGGAWRCRELVRNRARRRSRAHPPVDGARSRPGAAARGGNRNPPRRDRRPLGAEPSGAHPCRARARRCDAATAARRPVRRLAHAGGAGGGAVHRARSVAARRADQPPRSRSLAVARTVSPRLSTNLDPGQPRPAGAECRHDDDVAPRSRQADGVLGGI